MDTDSQCEKSFMPNSVNLAVKDDPLYVRDIGYEVFARREKVLRQVRGYSCGSRSRFMQINFRDGAGPRARGSDLEVSPIMVSPVSSSRSGFLCMS